jgi:hypothetical protein
MAVELADPLGSLVVGQRQDVEQVGSGSGTERVEAIAKQALARSVAAYLDRGSR